MKHNPATDDKANDTQRQKSKGVLNEIEGHEANQAELKTENTNQTESSTDNKTSSGQQFPLKRDRFLGWLKRWYRLFELTVPSTLSVGILTVIILQACIYFRQTRIMTAALETTKQQVSDTEKQFRISNRPWVAPIGDLKIIKPLWFDKDGPHVEVTFTLRNGGNSPAIHTTINAHLVPLRTWNERPDTERGNVPECDTYPLKEIIRKEDAAMTILPQLNAEMLKKQIDRRESTPVMTRNEWNGIFLVGCIGYIDEFRWRHRMSVVEQYVTGHFEMIGLGPGFDEPLAPAEKY